MNPPAPKTIVILGMHRSATSLVAGGVARLYPLANEYLPATASNPRGHWEDAAFVRLNSAILQRAGGTWQRPPTENAILAQADHFRRTIIDLIKARDATHDVWGWKDPRTTLTIRLYAPYLRNPVFVACFRDVKDVAASLNARNHMSMREGVLLAQEYNRRLLTFLSEVGSVSEDL